MLAVGPGERIGVLIGGLRHDERASFAVKLEFVVESADQWGATQLWQAVGVGDTQALRLLNIVEGIQESVERPRISEAEIIVQGAAEEVALAESNPARMIYVCAGTEAGRKRSQPRGHVENFLAVAVAAEEPIFCRHVEVEADIKIVELPDLAARVLEVVQYAGQVGQRIRAEQVEASLVDLARRNTISWKGSAGHRIGRGPFHRHKTPRPGRAGHGRGHD